LRHGRRQRRETYDKTTANQQVKLMKSFRVLRLFRRITALKKLLQSLGAALPVPPPTLSFPT
jgi:hypothetical protein